MPPNRRHLYHAEPLHATPKCHFSRVGGFPKTPAPAPPVCSPFAGAFQRPLTAVYLPAIGTFQRHSTHHVLHYWSPFDLVTAFVGAPSGCVQDALGVALAA
jgi:hypothetical protein